MRPASHIVSGSFFGATIEPGTFHGAEGSSGVNADITPPEVDAVSEPKEVDTPSRR